MRACRRGRGLPEPPQWMRGRPVLSQKDIHGARGDRQPLLMPDFSVEVSRSHSARVRPQPGGCGRPPRGLDMQRCRALLLRAKRVRWKEWIAKGCVTWEVGAMSVNPPPPLLPFPPPTPLQPLLTLSRSASSVEPPAANAASRAAASPALAALHTAPIGPALWLQAAEWMWPAAGMRRVMGDPAIDTLRAMAAPGRRVMPAGTGISISTQRP